jgi:hypothetical protein
VQRDTGHNMLLDIYTAMDPNSNQWIIPLLFCVQVLGSLTATLLLIKEEEDGTEGTPFFERVNITTKKLSVLRSLKGRLVDSHLIEDEEREEKRRKCYNYERAQLAIQEDYLRPKAKVLIGLKKLNLAFPVLDSWITFKWV